MFEIGPALREARERRGLAFGDVEADTAIRTRYIKALEEEQFHVLPGATYTKGFLRAYAEYLGLDGQLFIDELNSRHHDARTPNEQPIASRPRSRPHQRRQRRESNLVMIVLAAIVAVSALVLLATTFPNTPTARYPDTTTPGTGTTAPTDTTPAGGQKPHHKHANSPERPRLNVALVLSSSTWVRATTKTANGPGAVTSKGTDLGQGLLIDPAVTGSSRVIFTVRAPIFLRLGNPSAVTVTVNGKAVRLPAGVTAKSVIRIVSGSDIRA
jgi:cytoskeleton protein RodZ